MNYFFPNLDLFLTAIPKTGCTSAINFFVGLEESLYWTNLEKTIGIEGVNFSSPLNFLPGDVHLKHGPAQKYLTAQDLRSFKPILSLATIRNPYDRFESFWFEKIVFLSDINYRATALDLIRDDEIESLEGIRYAAKRFIRSLNFQDVESLDIHLKPQSHSLQYIQEYDYIVETQNLNSIPTLISESSARYRFAKNRVFPRNNSTVQKLQGNFYDEELMRLIHDCFEIDFNLFKEFFDENARGSLAFGENIEISQLQSLRANSEVNSMISERNALREQNAYLQTQVENLRGQVLFLATKLNTILKSIPPG